MSIGKKLLMLRQQRNLSQEELANFLHVSRQTISKWESDLSLPDMKMMLSISQFYDVPITELLGVDEKENVQESIEHIYEQTKAVLDKLSKETQKRRMRDWIIMGTCISSILIMCMLFWLIYFKPINKETQYIVDSPPASEIYSETLIDFANSSLRIEKYDLSHLLIYVQCQCALKEYTDQTNVKFGFIDENNKEYIYEAIRDNGNNFVYQDKIPLINYLEVKVYIEEGETKKVDSFYSSGVMYLEKFLQDYVSVSLPRDSQWDLMPDYIEYNFNSYYQEEVKYEGKLAGEMHLRVASIKNDNEVLLDQKIPLSEKKLMKLSRKIKNKEEIMFDVEVIIDGKTYPLVSQVKEIRYGSSMGYEIY